MLELCFPVVLSSLPPIVVEFDLKSTSELDPELMSKLDLDRLAHRGPFVPSVETESRDEPNHCLVAQVGHPTSQGQGWACRARFRVEACA